MSVFKTILFLIIFFALFIGLNYYIGKRLFSSISNIYKLNNKIFWGLFWFIAFSYIIYALLNRYFPKYLSNPLMYIGVYYMAISIYVLILFFIIDIFLIINKKFNLFPNIKDKSLFFTIIFFVLIVSFIGKGIYNAHSSYVKNYDIEIDKEFKNEKLNVVLISDIHLGEIIENSRIKDIVSKVNDLNPDIVLIAGDLIDSSIKPFEDNNMASELGKIKSKYGTFFSLGNHDLFDNKVDTLTTLLEKEGIVVLRDKATLINNSFYIVGRDDISISRFKDKRKDLKDIIGNVDKSKPMIVIDHNPSSLKESSESMVDIQVSGHTHKGQMVPFNLITKAIFENHYGYMKKGNLNLVVSSGFGTWGPPIRIGSRSEIVNIHLNGKKLPEN